MPRPVKNILKFCTFQTRHSCVLWGWGPTVHRTPTTSVEGARCTARSQPTPRKPHCRHPHPCITLPSPHPCQHTYLQDNIHNPRQATFTLLALLIHPMHTSSIPQPYNSAGTRGGQPANEDARPTAAKLRRDTNKYEKKSLLNTQGPRRRTTTLMSQRLLPT